MNAFTDSRVTSIQRCSIGELILPPEVRGNNGRPIVCRTEARMPKRVQSTMPKLSRGALGSALRGRRSSGRYDERAVWIVGGSVPRGSSPRSVVPNL